MAITLGLIALLAVVFLIGFSEAIGVAVVLVVAYLGLSAVVIGNGLTDVFGHPERLANRSTELRVKRVILEPQAEAIFARWAAAHPGPLRFIANKLDAGDRAEYDEKDYDVRAATHLGANDPAIFLEVAVADASEFSGDVVVGGELVGRHAVLRARGVAVPNRLAAIMLEVARQTAVPPHIYFAWSERGPAENAMLFLIGGGGDIPPLTHEILRVAEPDPARRPLVHVGG